jgi:hypothetical protein
MTVTVPVQEKVEERGRCGTRGGGEGDGRTGEQRRDMGAGGEEDDLLFLLSLSRISSASLKREK